VAAGQRHRQRDPVHVGDQAVPEARPGTADRARPRFGPPFSARTCELSLTEVKLIRTAKGRWPFTVHMHPAHDSTPGQVISKLLAYLPGSN